MSPLAGCEGAEFGPCFAGGFVLENRIGHFGGSCVGYKLEGGASEKEGTPRLGCSFMEPVSTPCLPCVGALDPTVSRPPSTLLLWGLVIQQSFSSGASAVRESSLTPVVVAMTTLCLKPISWHLKSP